MRAFRTCVHASPQSLWRRRIRSGRISEYRYLDNTLNGGIPAQFQGDREGQKPATTKSDGMWEFLLVDRQHISRIREQLDPSHGELVRERFLAKWEYRKAASQQDY